MAACWSSASRASRAKPIGGAPTRRSTSSRPIWSSAASCSQKFWLHIDREEQLRRFTEREKTPYKKYKITDEDHRNRERWDDYVSAVDDMVAHTSTDIAPWRLVPANDKRFARIAVLEAICDALARQLD